MPTIIMSGCCGASLNFWIVCLLFTKIVRLCRKNENRLSTDRIKHLLTSLPDKNFSLSADNRWAQDDADGRRWKTWRKRRRWKNIKIKINAFCFQPIVSSCRIASPSQSSASSNVSRFEMNWMECVNEIYLLLSVWKSAFGLRLNVSH